MQIFFFHWKDTFNLLKRLDETIFVHVCSGGLNQYLLEVRKRFLLLIHVCLFWIFLQFFWHIYSLPESETGHGIAQGSGPSWQPPLLKHTLHGMERRPKQGSARVRWVEMWRRALAVLNPQSSWVDCEILSPFASCQTTWLVPVAGLGTTSSHLHALKSTEQKLKASIYKQLPERNPSFLTPSFMGYFCHIFQHHPLPSCWCSRAETHVQSQSWVGKRSGLDTLRAHCRGWAWDTHLEILLRKISAAYAPYLMLFIWRKLNKRPSDGFAEGQR